LVIYLTVAKLFARGISILGSSTFIKAPQINVPLNFKENLWIHPNDILVGDQDGVVVVPPSSVDQVVQLCQKRKNVDEQTLRDRKQGVEMGPTI
jgi:regulator of RNase E activity RraA